jgi:hypothetical protein
MTLKSLIFARINVNLLEIGGIYAYNLWNRSNMINRSVRFGLSPHAEADFTKVVPMKKQMRSLGSSFLLLWGMVVAVLGLTAGRTLAAPETRTWVGASNGLWTIASNWTPSDNYPQPGDTVLVTNGYISLAEDTHYLASFTITNATVAFTNWSTKLQATNVTIQKNGRLRPAFGFLESDMSNRVYVVCSNLMIEPSGSIFADALGYRSSVTTVSGPGKGNSSGSRATGGSHGGLGGPCAVAPAAVYGDTNAPTTPGSTGGYGHNDGGTYAGNGGGAIRIVADKVVVNGSISANGGNSGTYGGGGSGGSIYITCNSFTGTGGIVRARGGNAALSDCGDGGGGRMAIECSNFVHPVGVSFSVSTGSGVGKKGQVGTLYLSSRALLSETLNQFEGARLFVGGFTSWTITNLIVSAGPVSIENTDFTNLTVETTMKILSNAWFCVGGMPLMTASGTASAITSANLTNPTVIVNGNLYFDKGILTVGGSGQKSFALFRAEGELVLTNGSSLRIYAGVTNSTTLSYSALFAATGGVTRIYPQSWIYSYANPTNGGAPKFHFGDVVVATNSGFFADGTGYQVGSGPGKGGGSGGSNTGAGGGHGGKGGNSSSAAGGNPYSSSNTPFRPGSGGGNYDGTAGHGGGAVWLKARDLTLNGRITANGLGGGTYNAGGAGGGIFIDCVSLTGDTNAVLRANGGDRNTTYSITGGGGGGRIAVALGFTDSEMDTLLAGGTPEGMVVIPPPDTFLGRISASQTTNSYSPPDTGTVRILKISSGFTVTVAGSPGLYGNPVPGYQNWPDIPSGSFFTNTVSTPADEANGVRHACIGWRLNQTAGGFVTSDTTTQAVFEVTEDLTVTWNWTNEYYLTVSAAVGGNATLSSNGWYVDGTPVSVLQAVADPGWAFASWGGDVPMNDATNNPLTVTMSQPRNLIACFYSTVTGTNRVWSGQGNWRMSATNWTPIGRPGPLDSVFLRTGSVVRISSPESISSLVVSNGASLIFTNWNTSLTVQNGVTIRTNGLITADGPYSYPSQMSNRVWIICRNFTLDPGGLINLNSKGYFTHTGPGKGGGGNSNGGSGGGHGGKGGNSSLGASGGGINGSTNIPQTPGSGGGGDYDNLGGHGGGVVWIDASGEVQLDGTILVNAVNGSQYNGGGSGGSILIYSGTFRGAATGSLRAEGGDRGTAYPGSLGGGGGGRIAVWINVPQAQRDQYLTGNTNVVMVNTTNRFFLGTVSVSNGLSCFMPPDVRAPDYGTALFFTPNPNRGTMFILK